MKPRWFFVSVLLLLFSGLILSCSNTPKQESQNHTRWPSNEADFEDALQATQPNTRDLTTNVANKDGGHIRFFFTALRSAQNLVTAFDLKLSNAKTDAQLSTLMRSTLYCNVQKVRPLHETAIERVDQILRLVLGHGPEHIEWYAQEISNFAVIDARSEATAANLLRHYRDHKMEFCGDEEDCLKPLFDKIENISFDFRKDKDFAKFMEANRTEIAGAFGSNSGLQPGSCFGDEGREPNQAPSYDWKNKNWVVGGMNPGEFVVTYDDGPHASYTRQLASVWSQTTFPKPTFFWLAQQVNKYEAIAHETYKEGFPVGSHSWSHPDIGDLVTAESQDDLGKVNRQHFASELRNVGRSGFKEWREAKLDKEILASAKSIQDSLRKVDPNFTLKYFRLPFGSGLKQDGVGRRFTSINVNHFFWKVDSLDWQDTNAVSVHDRVVAQMRAANKGLILFHDIQPHTIKASSMLIETFKNSSHWKPVSISQMVP